VVFSVFASSAAKTADEAVKVRSATAMVVMSVLCFIQEIIGNARNAVVSNVQKNEAECVDVGLAWHWHRVGRDAFQDKPITVVPKRAQRGYFSGT
jgi:hypothetical protein